MLTYIQGAAILSDVSKIVYVTGSMLKKARIVIVTSAIRDVLDTLASQRMF